eukprot:scaffold67692_cov36-Cyclotella_meneghiniana.AAC.2
MALGEKERGARGDDGDHSERTFEVGVKRRYRDSRSSNCEDDGYDIVNAKEIESSDYAQTGRG